MRPFMNILDVNDTCKRPITNLKRGIFAYGQIIQIHTIHKGNYAVAQWLPTGKEFLPREEFHEFRGGISTL